MANTQLSDRKRQEIEESFARQGFLAGMGARIADLSTGRCVLELPFGDAVSQQHDFFHGGALGALADTAGGYAAMTLAAEGIDVLTVEYKINFLRPAVGEMASAVGQVLRSGRTMTVTRADVFAHNGQERILCAALQQTIMTAAAAESRIDGQ